MTPKKLPTYERLHEIFEYKNGMLFFSGKDFDSLGRNRRYLAGKRAGSLHPLGYRKVSVDQVPYMEHRIIWLMHYKDSPVEFLDHINNKRDDNRIENLRPATRQENNLNAVIRKDNKLGIKGVHWNARDQRYTVALQVNGKRKTFGNYKDLELAELVAYEAREKYHGNFANHGLR